MAEKQYRNSLFVSFQKKWVEYPKSMPELKQYLQELKEIVSRDHYQSVVSDPTINDDHYIDLAIHICNNYDNITFSMRQQCYGNHRYYDDWCRGNELNPTIKFYLGQSLTVEFEIFNKHDQYIHVVDDMGMHAQYSAENFVRFLSICEIRYGLSRIK